MGLKSYFTTFDQELVYGDVSDLPESFDATVQWPDCVHPIRDQAHCGSCWAFAASEVLSDRYCIATQGKVNVVLSPEDLLACDYLDHGCNGGNPVFSWIYLRYFGIVTDECRPYTSAKGEVEKCSLFSHQCKVLGVEYKKYKSDSFPTIFGANVQKIKESLVKDGPVETGFSVYEDFMSYKSGIYEHKTGKLLGGHAVKIVGYGVENGVEYWKVANSWGEVFGEKGFFRIKIGECNFEQMALAGTVKN
jgi:cathepsin B